MGQAGQGHLKTAFGLTGLYQEALIRLHQEKRTGPLQDFLAGPRMKRKAACRPQQEADAGLLEKASAGPHHDVERNSAIGPSSLAQHLLKKQLCGLVIGLLQ